MKKQFFSFVMMIALVIVAGTAMAAPNKTVIKGGKYPYTLNGIVIVNPNSTVEITYANSGTVSDVTGTNSVPTTAALVAGTGNYAIPVGTTSINFNVLYDLTASSSGNIKVKITDGLSGCSNEILLGITVTEAPTIDLTVTSSPLAELCQTTDTKTDNIAASYNSPNTVTYTVSQTLDHTPATYTWGYTIKLPDPTLLSYTVKKGSVDVTADIKGSGGYLSSSIASGTTSEVYTVTFNTTTGAAAKSLVATLSNVILTDTGTGAGVYHESVTNNNSHTVTVKSLPSIGSFQ